MPVARRRWGYTGLRAAAALVLAAMLAGCVRLPEWWFLPPGEKRDQLRREEQQRRATVPADKAKAAQGGAVQPASPQHPVGIINDGEYPDSTVIIQNRWQGPVGDGHMVVYAGTYRDRPEKGIVIVHWRDQDWGMLWGRTIEAPGQPGSLRIVAEKDRVLTLKAASGQEFKFDMATATFAGE